MSFEIHIVKQYLVNVVLFVWNKGPVNIWNDRKAQKYKSNLYVAPLNIFPNFLHCIDEAHVSIQLL